MGILSGFNFKLMYVINFMYFIIMFCDSVIYHPPCILLQMTSCLALREWAENSESTHALSQN
jgi:hypothetical protein